MKLLKALSASLTLVGAAITGNLSAATYDLAADYSTNSNPAGVWSYGYKTTNTGQFFLFPRFVRVSDGGGYDDVWQKSTGGYSYITKNNSPVTIVTDGGAGNFPPGTVWFYPGYDGAIDNFGAARFTVPSGGDGEYEIVTAVRSYLDGAISGDTDFHVVRSGNEIFGQFLPGNGSTSYSNRLALVAGETIDFLVGRGADGHLYASALKIVATIRSITSTGVAPTITSQPQGLTVEAGSPATFSVGAHGTAPLSYQWFLGTGPILGATSASYTIGSVSNSDAGDYSVVVSNNFGFAVSSNATLRVQPRSVARYDLATDYSTNSNPSGVWSYGYKSTIDGAFVIYPRFYRNAESPAGAYSDLWIKQSLGYSYIAKNNSPLTIVSDGGAGNFPPGTVWFYPGYDGAIDNFGAIRFTVPSGGDGQYEIVTSVRSYLDGSISGDTDFHVVDNGNEILGQFLPGNSGTTYSNRLGLTSGETIDFLVGRGADGHLYASALKIVATIRLVTAGGVAPRITGQPKGLTVEVGDTATFSVGAQGTPPLSYQWQFKGNPILGANSASYSIASVQPSDDGDYSVVVSNSFGFAPSSAATLTVEPKSLAKYDLATDYSTNANPAGVWSYGYESTVGGNFVVYPRFWHYPENPPGAYSDIWLKPEGGYSYIAKNNSPVTIISDGGAGNFPPGTVWFYPGYDGAIDNFGAVRFTVPSGSDGEYEIVTAVRSYLDGPISGDTDFHVVESGTEIFGEFLPGNGSTSYSNRIALAAGETIDFLVGRGADGHLQASALKIVASIRWLQAGSVAPKIASQPQSLSVEAGAAATFSVGAVGTAPLTYQWWFEGSPISGATAASLTINNAQDANMGSYSVVVSNDVGFAVSSPATLTVEPRALAKFDLSTDYSTNANPSGPWSYGYKTTIGGGLVVYPRFLRYSENPAGAYADLWLKVEGGYSYIAKNNSPVTIVSDGGAGHFPPGTVWFYPGYDGAIDNFGAIRFTVPSGQSGVYDLTSAVRSYLDGPISGDADFHIVKNGVEIFGENVPGNSGAGYSNRLSLVRGDTIDFLVGRGADGHLYASALKIRATFSLRERILSPSEAAEVILEQIQATDFGRRNKRPLIATLESAIASLDAGHTQAGLNDLRGLQQKIRSQVAPFDPVLAQAWIDAIQEILDTAQ